MVCKSCGTKLIRGHAFCMNCGNPVPPGMGDEDDGMTPVNDLFANGNGDNDTESGGSDEGTLVFCPACGMHMQKDPYRCEKCGMIIRENIHSDNPQSVPAFNPDVGIGELNGGIGGFGIGGGMESFGGNVMSGGMGSIGGGMASVGGGMGSIGGKMGSLGASKATI
ncbi:MAG: hypothetical protein K2N56_00070 [Oscillospiraceae bacterium]|nr:hypothetical protein [Oscillospiraceae bacterium]